MTSFCLVLISFVSHYCTSRCYWLSKLSRVVYFTNGRKSLRKRNKNVPINALIENSLQVHPSLFINELLSYIHRAHLSFDSMRMTCYNPADFNVLELIILFLWEKKRKEIIRAKEENEDKFTCQREITISHLVLIIVS